MKYALANMLNGYGVRGLDTDAKAYIDAVVAAGATMTSTQQDAINAFVKGGKTNGWWSSMKRLHLPIWGIAAPNAIEMVTRTSGTFVGTVTHGSGFVKGDGSTGYFDFGARMPNDGLSSDNGLLFCLVKAAETLTAGGASMMGVNIATGAQLIRQATSSAIQARYTATSLSLTSGNLRTGIISISATSNTSRSFRRRSSSGVNNLGTSSGEAAFSLLNINCYAMARNSSGISEPTNAELGSYGYALGLNDSSTDAFTLALKNLWETCTGLTLP